VHVENLVDFDHVLEKHEDHIREEASLPAEVGIGVQGHDLGEDLFEIAAVLEDLGGLELADVVANLGHAFGKDVGLVGDIQVDFQVGGVLLAQLHVHADFVLAGCVFGLGLVRVQQVLLFFEFLVDLAVDLDVLEAAVQNDHYLDVDGPVVQVGHQALVSKFERAGRGDLVLVLAIHALEQV
jgi:hypothetical protein